MRRYLSGFIILFLLSAHTYSQVKLPAIFRDSMILQRDDHINVWGWASKNEKVKIKFNGKIYKAIAAADGKWLARLSPMIAGGPYTMEISARNKIVINEILVGDVWFCSGQSNMVHQMNIHDVTYAKDIAEANYPQIRQFWIPTATNLQGLLDDLSPVNQNSFGWKAAVGDNVRPFSAVAYFFARHIYDNYHIPIGIINASVGGTPIEAWTSEEGLKDFSTIFATIQKNKDTSYVNNLNRAATAANKPQQENDLGTTGELKWYDASYSPKGWKPINIPGYWEDQGIKELNGIVWYRKEIDIPSSMTGKAARIFLGRIVDADALYINGKEVGRTAYLYPQRRYRVPQDLLKTGKNIFVIRVTNNGGKGGFVPDKPYCLFTGNDTIDLKGTWQYKVGDVFAPRPAGVSAIVAQNQPTALYNAMVAPVINYTIKGFLWYQGEANTSRAEEYAKLQPAQITDWRNKWKQGNLPFLFVQLPGFMDYNYLPSESNWAVLRESQLKSLSLPNTAMAVAIDLGEWNDIHPDNKKDVGKRLALAALKLTYGKEVVHSGPVYESSVIDGNKITIHFKNSNGLITNDGEAPSEFAIAGDDKKFIWAKAKIDGDKVIVWNDTLREPRYVRYSWADNPVNPNLYNKAGLPASPFRTDK